MSTLKAISVTNSSGTLDLGYYMGPNTNSIEENCGVDPCDWGDEAEKQAEELNKAFESEGLDLMASVVTYEEE